MIHYCYAAVDRVFFYFHKLQMNYFQASVLVSLLLTCLPARLPARLSELLAPWKACLLKPRSSLSTSTGRSSLLLLTLLFLPDTPPPRTPVWFMGLSSYLAQVISITAGSLCNKGIRCEGTALGPAVLSQPRTTTDLQRVKIFVQSCSSTWCCWVYLW